MGRRVVIDDQVVEATPVYVRQEARLRLEEISEGMEGIPPDSAFWASIRVSRLCVVVRGWSFFYTCDERGSASPKWALASRLPLLEFVQVHTYLVVTGEFLGQWVGT